MRGRDTAKARAWWGAKEDNERRTEARERRRAVKDVEGEGEALQKPGWSRRWDG